MYTSTFYCHSRKSTNHCGCVFLLEVCRQDSLEYPPNTLYCIACGIMRHIREYNPEVKERVDPITFEEEEMLWEKGLFGTSSVSSDVTRHDGVHVQGVLCFKKWPCIDCVFNVANCANVTITIQK